MNQPSNGTSIGFKEFCESTSLHGWGIMAIGGFKKPSMLFWLAAIFLASTALVILTTGNISEYVNEVEYNVESMAESMDQVYFPAIYLSKRAQFRKSVLAQWLKLDPKWKNHTYNTYESFQPLFELYFIMKNYLEGKTLKADEKEKLSSWMESDFSKQMIQRFINKNKQRKLNFKDAYGGSDEATLYHNHSIQHMNEQKLKEEMNSVQISKRGYFGEMFGFTQVRDFLMKLQFRGKGVLHYGGSYGSNDKRRNWFLPFYEFFPEGKKSLKSFVKPMVKGGKSNGVVLAIDGEFWDDVTRYYTNGYKVGLAHPLDTELLEFNGIDVMPGEFLKIRVSSKIIKTSESIRLDATKRKCYFDGEVELDHYPSHWFRYSIDNCLMEAYFQKIEEICNCSHFIVKNKPSMYEYCEGEEKSECLTTAVDNLTIGGQLSFISRGRKHTCLVNCNDQTIRTSASTLKLLANSPKIQVRVLRKLEESCSSFKREMIDVIYPNICKSLKELGGANNTQSMGYPELLKYVQNNVIYIGVYFDHAYVEVIERSPKMSIPTLFSNVGGAMGLCLGFSVLSLVEIVYFALIWVMAKFNSLVVVKPVKPTTVINVQSQPNMKY